MVTVAVIANMLIVKEIHILPIYIKRMLGGKLKPFAFDSCIEHIGWRI